MNKYKPYIKKYWYSFLLGPFFMVLEACGEFILPFINANIIDKGAANGDVDYIIQNGLIGLISTGLAFALSKVCLLLMNNYVASMGVVLNMGMVYPMEFIILLAVFLISVIPTVIWTFFMSRKDGIGD